MISSELYNASIARWNCFAAIDCLGSFDFATQTIRLESLNQRDISDLKEMFAAIPVDEQCDTRTLGFESYQLLDRILPLAIHEYTHFLDCNCTAWGAAFLRQLDAGYRTNPDLFPQIREKDFPAAKALFDTARSIGLPKYFTAITPGVDASTPWNYQMTIGFRFDSRGATTDRPICFAAFRNSRNQRIVRSPISMTSLLEASAMAQEYENRARLAYSLDETSRIVEWPLLAKRNLELIYNPKLTEYTVCAHIVANAQNQTDMLEVLRVCDRLVRVVLNLTASTFRIISLQVPTLEKLGLRGSPSVPAIENGLRYQDRGIAFYLVARLMPQVKSTAREAIDAAIQVALVELGLDLNSITMEARREVELAAEDLSGSPIEAIRALSSVSLHNFDRRAQEARSRLIASNFDLPPFFLDDMSTAKIFGSADGRLGGIDLDAMWMELVVGQNWVESFADACR